MIHPGYGKTATTWFQTHILPQLEDVSNLGKGGCENGTEEFINDKLSFAQNQLFNPRLRKSDNKKISYHINQYVNVLTNCILSEVKKANNISKDNIVICISDETIFEIEFFYENAVLLQEVLIEVKDRLKLTASLFVKITITHREQSSFLKSFYAYEYHSLKSKFSTFDSFIKYGIENNDRPFFQMLDYYVVSKKLKDIFKLSDFEILFLPYELIYEDPRKFIKAIFGTTPMSEAFGVSLIEADVDTMINVNRLENGKHILRDQSVFMTFMEKLLGYQDFVKFNNQKLGKMLKPLKHLYVLLLRNFGGFKEVGYLNADHDLIVKFQALYRASNQKLKSKNSIK